MTPDRRRSIVQRVLPIGLIGLAAALRLHDLAWKSVDNDESFSWAITQKPLAQILAESMSVRGDPHPPVYWVALKAWTAVAGTSELSMRWLSAMAGVLFVALVVALGRRLFSHPASLAAGTFAALSPLLIWNSQDARMYTLGGTLALAGVSCLAGGLASRSLRWWVGYFLFTALACYTHLAAAFLLPFEALLFLIGARRFRQTWWRAGLTLAGVGVTYLPFALNVWRASGSGHNDVRIRYALRFDQLLHNATLLLTTYQGQLTVAQQWLVVLFVVGLFGLGVVAARKTMGRWGGLGWGLVALWYLVPLAVIEVLSLREPVYQTKSLTFVGAALALGVGSGWARVWRWRRGLAAAVGMAMIGVQAYGIAAIWRLENVKEDWRHAGAYVARHAEPGDVVLVHLEYYRDAFRYYFDRPIPVVAPFGSHLSGPQEVDATLGKFTEHGTVWLVQSGTYLTGPNRLVEGWLDSRYPLETAVYPSGITVKGFAIKHRLADLPDSATRLPAAYPNGLRLLGIRIPEQVLPARDTWLHPPSPWVHVTLYWSVAQPLAEDVRVAIALEDAPGDVWGGDLPRSNDLRTFYPPLRWRPDEVIRQDFDVNVNPEAPAGEYKLVLRAFDPSGASLVAAESGEEYLILGTVSLTGNE